MNTDNPKEDAVQTLRDMNRVSNVGINMSPNDLNIGALASLQVTCHIKILFFYFRYFLQGIDAVSKTWNYRSVFLLLSYVLLNPALQQELSDGR